MSNEQEQAKPEQSSEDLEGSRFVSKKEIARMLEAREHLEPLRRRIRP